MFMLTEKLLMTKNADATTLPIIVTSRDPNTLAIALAIGPVHRKQKTVYIACLDKYYQSINQSIFYRAPIRLIWTLMSDE